MRLLYAFMLTALTINAEKVNDWKLVINTNDSPKRLVYFQSETDSLLQKMLLSLRKQINEKTFFDKATNEKSFYRILNFGNSKSNDQKHVINSLKKQYNQVLKANKINFYYWGYAKQDDVYIVDLLIAPYVERELANTNWIKDFRFNTIRIVFSSSKNSLDKDWAIQPKQLADFFIQKNIQVFTKETIERIRNELFDKANGKFVLPAQPSINDKSNTKLEVSTELNNKQIKNLQNKLFESELKEETKKAIQDKLNALFFDKHLFSYGVSDWAVDDFFEKFPVEIHNPPLGLHNNDRLTELHKFIYEYYNEGEAHLFYTLKIQVNSIDYFFYMLRHKTTKYDIISSPNKGYAIDTGVIKLNAEEYSKTNELMKSKFSMKLMGPSNTDFYRSTLVKLKETFDFMLKSNDYKEFENSKNFKLYIYPNLFTE